MKKFILALVLVAAGTVLAIENIVNVYPSNLDVGELDSATSAETADLGSTSYAGRSFFLNHHQNVTVSATFSTAGANAVIGIVKGHVVAGTFKPDRIGPGEWATITAQSTFTIGGRYVAKSVAFDTSNYEAAFIYVQSVSAGNVVAGWSVH